MKRLSKIFALLWCLLIAVPVSADQTLSGGNSAGDNLHLRSTRNAVKGYVGVDSNIVPGDVLAGTGIVTSAGLAIGSIATNVSSTAFSYNISGVGYTKAAVSAGTAPGDDVIPEDTYGSVALDIGADGVIDVVEATANATGYSTAALAVAGIPAVATDHVRMGTVTAMKSDGAFTFGTTALNAANVTTIYSSTPNLDSLALVPTASGWTATTQFAGDNSGNIATTAYVDTALSGKLDAVSHSAQCVLGYDSSNVYGCWSSWAAADVGAIVTNATLSTNGDVTINTSSNTLQYYSGTLKTVSTTDHTHTRTEEIIIPLLKTDLTGGNVTAGVQGDRYFDHAMTITKWTLLADQAGTCKVELWKDTYANYPATVTDLITSVTPPILGTHYSKAAVAAGTAPGNDIIPSGTYGAVAFDIGTDGTIDVVEATANATGYGSAAEARSGCAAVASNHVRIGYVTVIKSDGAFTFGTTALNATNVTTVYTSTIASDKGIVMTAALGIGTTTTNVANQAFNYYIGGVTKQQSSTLTGWTTAISAGDTLRVNVGYCDTVTRATLILTATSAQ